MKQRRKCYEAPHLRCDRTGTRPIGKLCDASTVVGRAAHIEGPYGEAAFGAAGHTTVDRARVRHFISLDVGLKNRRCIAYFQGSICCRAASGIRIFIASTARAVSAV